MRAACGKAAAHVEGDQEFAALMYPPLMARGRSHCRLERERLFTVAVLAFTALCACGYDAPNRATAPIYKGDDETSGGQARTTPSANVDDDAQIKTLFYQVTGAERIRTCAPASAPWVILTYAPDVLDEHRVRTREIHCEERVISERCAFIGDERYYLDDPNEYFSVGKGVKPERALQIAQLRGDLNERGRLMGISADKGGVYLITLGDCGKETQLAARLKGTKTQQHLEAIEVRYHVEL
jgi:hypothetical protein